MNSASGNVDPCTRTKRFFLPSFIRIGNGHRPAADQMRCQSCMTMWRVVGISAKTTARLSPCDAEVRIEAGQVEGRPTGHLSMCILFEIPRNGPPVRFGSVTELPFSLFESSIINRVLFCAVGLVEVVGLFHVLLHDRAKPSQFGMTPHCFRSPSVRSLQEDIVRSVG
jgi:hypothetical protein